MAAIPSDDEMSRMTRAQLRAVAPPCVKGKSSEVLRERLSAYRDKDPNHAGTEFQPLEATSNIREIQASDVEEVEPEAEVPCTFTCQYEHVKDEVADLVDWYEDRKRDAPAITNDLKPTPDLKVRVQRSRVKHHAPPPQSMRNVVIKTASQIKAERKAARRCRTK